MQAENNLKTIYHVLLEFRLSGGRCGICPSGWFWILIVYQNAVCTPMMEALNSATAMLVKKGCLSMFWWHLVVIFPTPFLSASHVWVYQGTSRDDVMHRSTTNLCFSFLMTVCLLTKAYQIKGLPVCCPGICVQCAMADIKPSHSSLRYSRWLQYKLRDL